MSTDVDELVAALDAARTEIERLRAERAGARARIAELEEAILPVTRAWENGDIIATPGVHERLTALAALVARKADR